MKASGVAAAVAAAVAPGFGAGPVAAAVPVEGGGGVPSPSPTRVVPSGVDVIATVFPDVAFAGGGDFRIPASSLPSDFCRLAFGAPVT